MMKKTILTTLLLFFVILLSAKTADALVDFKVEGRYWLTDVDSNITSNDGVIPGTNIDLVDDLGIDERENFWEARIIVGILSHKFRYGYMPMKWHGEKAITVPVTFKGVTFPVTTAIKTEVDVEYHRLGYEYDIIDTLDNKVGVILEAKYFDIDASLKSALTEEAEHIQAVFPTVGVAVNLGLPFLLNAGGEVTGMSLGDYGYMVDAEAMINFKPSPFVTISGGYRLFELNVDIKDDEGDLSVRGPFVMVRGGF